MSPTALLPLAIPGLSRLAAGAARSVSSGLSFAATLADGGAPPATRPLLAAGPRPHEAIPAVLQKSVDEYAAQLRHTLAGLGISLSGPVELSADVLGGIQANGNEQDSKAVEEVLGRDQELSAAFLQLAAEFQRATGVLNAAQISMPWDTAGA